VITHGSVTRIEGEEGKEEKEEEKELEWLEEKITMAGGMSTPRLESVGW
jgi:hypothetical protein